MKLLPKNYNILFNKAKAQRAVAYAPYSGFHVGAALSTKEGEIFCGCNVENRSFGLTNCAERTAIFNMISGGAKAPETIVITSDTVGSVTYPCGACLQVLTEFNKNMTVICTDSTGTLKEVYTALELFPKCSI